MAATKSSPDPICLDLTRTASRIGRGPLTGIDRVELRYLDEVLSRDGAIFGLLRIGRRYYLLDRDGMRRFRSDLGAGLSKRRVFWHVVRASLASGFSSRLAAMLARHLPIGTHYFNVGHSNLTLPVVNAVRSAKNCRITAIIHDTIPLDFPQFQRPNIPKEFRAKLDVVSTFADRIIAISDVAAQSIEGHLPDADRPDIQVVRLGVDEPVPGPLPVALPESYFVVLGTIEPRKNHALLLDIWAELAEAPGFPTLVIIGRRGWENEAVFARLDAKPAGVIELNDLDDAAVAQAIKGARALLFPTFAEGFGLPAVEAARLGVPVVANDLPVFQEILGNYPVYADVADRYLWQTIIKKMANSSEYRDSDLGANRHLAGDFSWSRHFEQVFGVDS